MTKNIYSIFKFLYFNLGKLIIVTSYMEEEGPYCLPFSSFPGIKDNLMAFKAIIKLVVPLGI